MWSANMKRRATLFNFAFTKYKLTGLCEKETEEDQCGTEINQLNPLEKVDQPSEERTKDETQDEQHMVETSEGAIYKTMILIVYNKQV